MLHFKPGSSTYFHRELMDDEHVQTDAMGFACYRRWECTSCGAEWVSPEVVNSRAGVQTPQCPKCRFGSKSGTPQFTELGEPICICPIPGYEPGWSRVDTTSTAKTPLYLEDLIAALKNLTSEVVYVPDLIENLQERLPPNNSAAACVSYVPPAKKPELERVEVRPLGSTWVADRPHLSGSPIVGRGKNWLEALGSLLVQDPDRFGVRAVVFDECGRPIPCQLLQRKCPGRR